MTGWDVWRELTVNRRILVYRQVKQNIACSQSNYLCMAMCKWNQGTTNYLIVITILDHK